MPFNLQSFSYGANIPKSSTTQWAGASDWSSPVTSSLFSAASAASGAKPAASAFAGEPSGPVTAAASTTPAADTRSVALLNELRMKYLHQNTLSKADFDRLIAGGYTWADLNQGGGGSSPIAVNTGGSVMSLIPYGGDVSAFMAAYPQIYNRPGLGYVHTPELDRFMGG